MLYQGKAASLGIKQSSQPQNKWAELTITKSPKIVHIALGHDGLHALMVAEDGSVYFVGTARRGEDGDASGGITNFILLIYFSFSDADIPLWIYYSYLYSCKSMNHINFVTSQVACHSGLFRLEKNGILPCRSKGSGSEVWLFQTRVKNFHNLCAFWTC